MTFTYGRRSLHRTSKCRGRIRRWLAAGDRRTVLGCHRRQGCETRYAQGRPTGPVRGRGTGPVRV